MKSSTFLMRAAIAAGALALTAGVALAATAAPTPNKGDTAWMLISTALVLFMTIPGLALFYGGLVRTKNMASVLTQVFAIVCIAAIFWVTIGYSLAFTNGGGLNAYIGGFSKAFLAGVTPETVAATFSNGVVIPELTYVAFQMTFACITPALIVGAFAERVKFSALMLFTILFLIFIYAPIAHMVWYWAGPDALGDAAKAVVEAGTDAAKKAAAEAKLAEVTADAGIIFQWGALDFAGGTVVHINAGVAGLVGCYVIGKRIGFGKELMAPHSLTLTMVGAAMLFVGWFGFNAGSNLEANGIAALALINTFVAAVAGGLAWMLIEWAAKGKPSLLGLVSGVVAGLVAVTPASGWGGPMGCMVLGLVAGVVCFFFCTTVKNAMGYDDSLDVFGIHAVGGIIGALATGILVNVSLGGVGAPDYTTKPGYLLPMAYEFGTQMWAQIKGILLTVAWTGIGSFILFKIVDAMVGLRVSPEQEREGLDIGSHGERSYNY